ncbi:hypothetical protein Tco_0232130 [Tanacetum coccineum]
MIESKRNRYKVTYPSRTLESRDCSTLAAPQKPWLCKVPIPNVDLRKVQMNELNELLDQAYENSLIYKEKTKKIHDSKIKNHVFNVGDRVILFNSKLKIFLGKIKTCRIRPFTVAQVFPYRTIELSQTNGPNFKVNGHRLKHYFGGDIPIKWIGPDFRRLLVARICPIVPLETSILSMLLYGNQIS